MKQYLTKEQMQQLIDLGFDVSDAKYFVTSTFTLKEKIIYQYNSTDVIYKLPKEIKREEDTFLLDIFPFQNKWFIEYKNNLQIILYSVSNEELIDSCFDILCLILKDKNIE